MRGVPGSGPGGGRGSTGRAGGRKIVQGGMDHCVLGGGGGGNMLERGFAVGDSQHEVVKLAVQLLDERLVVPPYVGSGCVRDNSMVPLWESVLPKLSSWPVAAMDSRSSAAWRRLKKLFHSVHIWSSTVFPSQVGMSLGKEPDFISMQV